MKAAGIQATENSLFMNAQALEAIPFIFSTVGVGHHSVEQSTYLVISSALSLMK